MNGDPLYFSRHNDPIGRKLYEFRKSVNATLGGERCIRNYIVKNSDFSTNDIVGGNTWSNWENSASNILGIKNRTGKSYEKLKNIFEFFKCDLNSLYPESINRKVVHIERLHFDEEGEKIHYFYAVCDDLTSWTLNNENDEWFFCEKLPQIPQYAVPDE